MGGSKRIVVDLSLDQERHQAKVVSPGRRRELVDHLRGTWQVSARRACTERSSFHYKSRRGGQDELRKRIKEIAETLVHLPSEIRRGSRSKPFALWAGTKIRPLRALQNFTDCANDRNERGLSLR